MIRPITVICWIMALSAGLYLYRAKHEVELIDKDIDRIARETSGIRADSRRLLDEWIRLGEPEQLHKYSDQYLGLKTISPTQFVRLTDLPSRLPAPRADPPAMRDDAVDTGAGEAPGLIQPSSIAPAGADEMEEADDLPVPPIPPAIPTLTAIALPAVASASAATPMASTPMASTPVASLAPPLQARPVTPRPAAGQPDEPTRPAPARAVEDPKPAKPTLQAEPREVAPPPKIAHSPAAPTARPLAPSPAPGQGLPPLQAQIAPSPTPRNAGQPPAALPALRAPDSRPSDARIADVRQSDPRRDVRAVPVSPPRVQTMQSAPPPPAQETRYQGDQFAQSRAPLPAATGSLLGMSRGGGGVPPPLPAPTPMGGSWQGRPNEVGR